MATVSYCRMQAKDFSGYSQDWAMKIERKFGAMAGKQFAEVLNDQYASKDELLNDLEDRNWYDSLIMDKLHNDKSAYVNKHFCNTFYVTLKAIINGKDYMSNVQKQSVNNNIFDECIRKELERVGYNKQGIMRISWRVNSFCLIYSRSNKSWCIGKIVQIFTDKKNNEEWLVVKYGKTIKNIQRFSKYIKPIINTNDPLQLSNPSTNNDNKNKTKTTKANNIGLTFHFYGIKHEIGTSKYYKHYKNVLSFKNLDPALLITINSSLRTNDTVFALKKLIRKVFGISSSNDILIMFGDNIISDSNYFKLRNFGISNHSLLLLAVNGDTNPYKYKHTNIVKKCNNNNKDNCEAKTKWNYTLSIKTRKGFDIITQESNAELFKMPNCGHYMAKESLYQYAYNQLKDTNNLYLKCPHKATNDENEIKYEEWCQWPCTHCTFLNDIDENVCEMCENPKQAKKIFCESKWNYSLIKQILSFNDENNWINTNKLELLLARNKIENECHVQKCPKCNTLHYKNENNYSWSDIKTRSDIKKAFKTECKICSNKFKSSWNNYHNINSFCFCCGKEWMCGHICDSSFKSDLIQILNKADRKQIGPVDDVPSIRCCPNCAQLITHMEACKHMECSQCNTDFCFVCLSICINGQWPCGASGDRCSIAPTQNINTLPNTIVINKKSFHLF